MKKFRFLYIAAAALLFAACANEEDGIGNNGPVAATVQADISNNIKTRGTADNNSWTAGDAIGVYVTSSGNTTGDNKKYVTTNGDGTFEAADNNNIIYFKDNKETTFSAYYQGRRIKLNYPSTACLSSPHSIPLSVVLD